MPDAVDPYRVPCRDCYCPLVFICEDAMLWHYTIDHLPRPDAFIRLALDRAAE